MNVDWSFVTAIAGLIVGLAALINAWVARRRVTAETHNFSAQAGKAAAESVDLLLIPLNDEIEKCKKELGEARGAIAQLVADQVAEREAHAAEKKDRDKQRAQMQSEIDEMRGGVAVLVSQLEAAGIVPRYVPKAMAPK